MWELSKWQFNSAYWCVICTLRKCLNATLFNWKKVDPSGPKPVESDTSLPGLTRTNNCHIWFGFGDENVISFYADKSICLTKLSSTSPSDCWAFIQTIGHVDSINISSNWCVSRRQNIFIVFTFQNNVFSTTVLLHAKFWIILHILIDPAFTTLWFKTTSTQSELADELTKIDHIICINYMRHYQLAYNLCFSDY